MSDHTLPSSADTSGSSELKAGHAPALKVGGMRVGAGRPRQTSQGDDKDKNMSNDEATGDNGASYSREKSTRNNNHENTNDTEESGAISTRVAGQMVSGTFVPVQKAFPTEGVKHIHDKPGTYPKNEYHSHSKHDDQRFINQPRKY
ncbi:unnamed protein product [Adineta ricciae]|uniref:Death-associated protein 1 n=1 Tax=Adineta ricciae TaxID=249248 RepID=A0A814UNH2_ADIRI|nr:unnamed protein product [Adineta ricciae]CAF1534400.1 unnamed protein product [Adineta ricciae]